MFDKTRDNDSDVKVVMNIPLLTKNSIIYL